MKKASVRPSAESARPSSLRCRAGRAITSLAVEHRVIESDKGLIILVPGPDHKRLGAAHVPAGAHELQGFAHIPQTASSEVTGGALQAVGGAPEHHGIASGERPFHATEQIGCLDHERFDELTDEIGLALDLRLT
jgi:hypothetical protein